MNREEKDAYLEKYKEEKEKGESFFPYVLFNDALVALIIFLLLVALAYFIGTPLEPPADPADTMYTPKPEWYFLSVFQMLKYFPGELEVVGVVILPTIATVLLFLLPFLDRGPKRHYRNRPLITIVTILIFIGAAFLTVQSMIENPPPAEAAVGDLTAELYTDNCAGCHGDSIDVPVGINLHDIIAGGQHEGMPAWTADLTTDEIDALAGFILSPAGSELFTEHCSECHETTELVASNPLELKNSLELGIGYPQHADIDLPDLADVLSREERTSLLNFLIAPDGRRLFVTNCASCHGRSVGFVGEEEELRDLIFEGGLHLEMPPWQEKLSSLELDQVTRYVIDPATGRDGQDVYDSNCSRCHGDIYPEATAGFDETREIIATGGSHQTMPVWGDLLTPEQLDALVGYSLEATSGAPLVLGQQLFTENCASCHGDLGEGGENPALPGDIIAPISTAEYLKTRDDLTLRSIIAQGQPNFGMSPFGSPFGGPLDNDQIDSLVVYLRSWEEDPPVELPPEITVDTVDLSGFDIYTEICAQCHGITGSGGVGPSLRAEAFRTTNSSQQIFDTISLGHDVTDMIAWGAILSSEQIQQLVSFIEQLPVDPAQAEEVVADDGADESDDEAADEEDAEPEPTPEPTEDVLSFSANIFPILESRCVDCHGTDGGWDTSTYDLLMTTGDNGPVVIPGDVDGSLLAQKLLGTHEEGDLMPPPPLRALQDELIQLILDWIAAGALDN
jgi:mono/diheme cytochrome c family protein